MDNPVLSSLARTALWSDGAVIFRVAEDGSATTVDEEMTITRVSFVAGAHSDRPWPFEPMKPAEVPPVVFSEVLRDVESL